MGNAWNFRVTNRKRERKEAGAEAGSGGGTSVSISSSFSGSCRGSAFIREKKDVRLGFSTMVAAETGREADMLLWDQKLKPKQSLARERQQQACGRKLAICIQTENGTRGVIILTRHIPQKSNLV